jgi:hypothetical protein
MERREFIGLLVGAAIGRPRRARHLMPMIGSPNLSKSDD